MDRPISIFLPKSVTTEMSSSFSFELPQEGQTTQDERETSFIPFDKVFEYLVNNKRLTVSFAKESKALTEQVELAIETLPDDAKEIANQNSDGFICLYFILNSVLL